MKILINSLELDNDREIKNALLKADPELTKLKEQLLPLLTEDQFWKIGSILNDISYLIEDQECICSHDDLNELIASYSVFKLARKDLKKIHNYYHTFSKCFFALIGNQRATTPDPPLQSTHDLT